ncbi:hypothetical protein D0T53_02575 [Dysgonomonas sp. 216]|uniref:carboxypeptidase-like regulatory domain-containing protein n=1 Tax=Dysgonomonas sp. 216 TaxID=2302934 RepID=UPI0013D46A1C|nr:carboxypeptidase-like regulatory domain-containing protein [Dysgonomonas sp. 216]NDW17800.1 hypothetical protein [Dysgonomonas sp. 216]
MKGKLALLMGVFIVISFFLYQYKGDKRLGSKNDKTLNVTGIVVDESNDMPVSRATIEIQDEKVKVLTNEYGEFKIPARRGQKLYVSHPYYKRRVVEVTGIQLDIKLIEKKESN